MSSGNNEQFSTFNLMGYEQLTGNKAPPPPPPTSSTSTSTARSPSGTGKWDAGLVDAGSFLDDLGLSGSAIDRNGMGRNTTWDIPPHSVYPSTQRGYNSAQVIYLYILLTIWMFNSHYRYG